MTTTPEAPALPGDLTDETIERAARAIFEVHDLFDYREWADLDSQEKELYLRRARAALAAAGVAPVTPSELVQLDVDEGGNPVYGHVPAPSPDREKLIAEAQKAVWSEIHGQEQSRTYSVAEVKQLVYSLDNAIATALAMPAAPSPDRERGFRKLEAVQGILAAAQSSVADASRELSLAVSALAVPPVVNEAKLAEIIGEHVLDRYDTDTDLEVCACSVATEDHDAHVAAVLVERQREWLGNGR